jgi:hypothetical protein
MGKESFRFAVVAFEVAKRQRKLAGDIVPGVVLGSRAS